MWRILPFLMTLEDDVEESNPSSTSEQDKPPERDPESNPEYRLPEISEETDRHFNEPDLEHDVTDGYPEPEFADPKPIFNYNPDELEGVETEPTRGSDEFIEKAYEDTEKELKGMREQASNDNEKSLWDRFAAGVKNIPYQAANAIATVAGTPVALYQNRKTKQEIKENPKTSKKIMYITHGLGQTRGSAIVMARQAREEGFLPIILKGNHRMDSTERLESQYEQISDVHKETGLEDIALRKDIYRGHSSGGNLTIDMASDPRSIEHGIGYGQAIAPAPYGITPKSLTQRILMKVLPGASDEDTRTESGKKMAIEYAAKRPVLPIQVVGGQHDAAVPPEDAIYRHAANIRHIKGPGSTHFRTSHIDRKTNQETLQYLNEFMNSIQNRSPSEPGMRYDRSTGFERAASETPRPEDYEPKGTSYERAA